CRIGGSGRFDATYSSSFRGRRCRPLSRALYLRDALPILQAVAAEPIGPPPLRPQPSGLPSLLQSKLSGAWIAIVMAGQMVAASRSEEHTSELQSLRQLVCRLLLEKKKYTESTVVCVLMDF